MPKKIVKKIKQRTTLKQWQEIYPDAMQFTLTASAPIPDDRLIKMCNANGFARVLYSTFYGTVSAKKAHFVTRGIVSHAAYERGEGLL